MALLPSGVGRLGMGLGGGLAGRVGSGALDVLNQPQQAVNSLAMALMGRQAVPPSSGTGRQAAEGLAGMMAMGGGPGDMGLGRAAQAASMMGGVEGMPYTLGSSLDQTQSVPGDMRQGSWLPAALGMVATGASAFTPWAPAAIPIGAAVAGLLQKAMNSYDPNQYGSFNTSEVMDQTGLDPNAWYRPGLDAAVGMGTDPLTWAGAVGGGNAPELAAAGQRGVAAAGRALGLGGNLSQEAKLSQYAEQAARVGRASQDLEGVERSANVTPMPLPGLSNLPEYPTMGATFPMQSPLLPQPAVQEIVSELAKLQMRTQAFHANWEARAAARAGELPWGGAIMEPEQRVLSAAAAQMPATNVALPAAHLPQGGATFAMSPSQIAALPPGAPLGPAPQPTTVLPNFGPAANPFTLPAGMDPNASLTQAYGSASMGNVPQMPLGSPAYKMVNPEVQALLQQLGIPTEMGLSRGGLPPWAQVRGGRVGMAPGMAPQDVLRGARAAAGY